MLIALSTCAKDVDAAGRLLEWMDELGGCHGHDLLLVADHGMQWSTVLDLLEVAKPSFDQLFVAASDHSVDGWPGGANELWLVAARFAKQRNRQWLWMEPDAIPMRKGWADALQTAYTGGYMGHVYDCSQPNLPSKLLSGVAMYPATALDLIGPLIAANPNKAFDVLMAPAVVPYARPTKLIHHFWGKPGLPPIFVESKQPGMPENAVTLSFIPPEAVLFHRCKDNSLVDLLQVRLGFRSANKNFVIALNVCNADVDLMIRNLEWMGELGGCPQHRALLSYDPSIHRGLLDRVRRTASPLFQSLTEYRYPEPTSTQFIHASRWAFLHVARYMENTMKSAWLWYESDFWPLKRGWADKLQAAYNHCGKPFFGSVIPGAGHANGTAIYPFDCYSRCPSVQVFNAEAFDTGMRPEIQGRIFDASHLMQCAWVESGGQLLSQGEGELPGFPTIASTRRLLPTAVTFHRVKNSSLADRLREAQNQHNAR